MSSVYKWNNTGPYIVSWFDATGRRREKSSRTTDKRVAERIAAKLDADAALRRDGVVDARQDRLFVENRKPVVEHIQAYLNHCRHAKHSVKHIQEKTRHLNRLVDETGAIEKLPDIESPPRAAATGTCDSDPQQIPRQSERNSQLRSAKRCDEDAIAASNLHAAQPLDNAKLCEKMRTSATPHKNDCGRNSVVECQLPKLDVVGSNPIARYRLTFVRGL